MIVNPKTQAVIEAFLDIEAPPGLRPSRAAELRMSRPKLYAALEALTNAIYYPSNERPLQTPHKEDETLAITDVERGAQES